MKRLIFIALFISFAHHSVAQDCRLVSKTKNKETGLVTKGGVVNSEDFYSLLIQKKIGIDDTLNYHLLLNAASKLMLSDSMVNSKGTFQLYLTNGDSIVLKDAKCSNNSLGLGAAVAFRVFTSEEAIAKAAEYPIHRIKVFGILETKFSARNLKQQQKILGCLMNEN